MNAVPPALSARAVAVFCGSRTGHDPALIEATAALGHGLAAQDTTLIYGGGRIGLMGVLADSVLAAGGRVTGVIPDFLRLREVAHPGVTDLRVTDSMHSRKRLMFELADAFVTLPGGLGTLDETVEVITWAQLGQHTKPIVLCDLGGWATALLGALRMTVTQGFTSAESMDLFEVVPDVPALLGRLARLGHVNSDGSRL